MSIGRAFLAKSKLLLKKMLFAKDKDTCINKASFIMYLYKILPNVTVYSFYHILMLSIYASILCTFERYVSPRKEGFVLFIRRSYIFLCIFK